MFAFKMDCKVRERRFRYVHFTLEKEITEREGFLVLILVGGSHNFGGGFMTHMSARFEIYGAEWEQNKILV
jgi:hypothetical protein